MRRLFFCLVLALTCFAERPLRAQVHSYAALPDSALHRLMKVGYFAFGGVGYAGVTSPGELDFRTLAAQPRELALALFERLYAEGDAAAKCYALVGIRRFDPERFKAIVGAIHHDEKVSTMSGCIVGSESFAEVARSIGLGKFDPWIRG